MTSRPQLHGDTCDKLVVGVSLVARSSPLILALSLVTFTDPSTNPGINFRVFLLANFFLLLSIYLSIFPVISNCSHSAVSLPICQISRCLTFLATPAAANRLPLRRCSMTFRESVKAFSNQGRGMAIYSSIIQVWVE